MVSTQFHFKNRIGHFPDNFSPKNIQRIFTNTLRYPYFFLTWYWRILTRIIPSGTVHPSILPSRYRSQKYVGVYWNLPLAASVYCVSSDAVLSILFEKQNRVFIPSFRAEYTKYTPAYWKQPEKRLSVYSALPRICVLFWRFAPRFHFSMVETNKGIRGADTLRVVGIADSPVCCAATSRCEALTAELKLLALEPSAGRFCWCPTCGTAAYFLNNDTWKAHKYLW